MELKFNDISTVINSDADGIVCLTDAMKAWRESGGTGGQLDHWKRKPEIIDMIETREIRVFEKRGNGGGTWGCKEALIEYASYCSPEFRRAVRKAFIALTEGKPYEAAAIAESVAVSDELKQRYERTEARFDAAVDSLDNKHMRINYRKLRSKAVTGYTPKQLTNGTASMKDYLIEQESSEGLSAGIAAMEMIITGIQAGIGYHVTAAMMKVLTGQNKELLAANGDNYKEAANG